MTPDELRKLSWDDNEMGDEMRAAADAWDFDKGRANLFKRERDDAEAKIDRIANGIAVLGEENIALRKQLNVKLGQHYAEVCRLTKRIEDLRRRLEAAEKALPKSIQEALNSGDGVYRP